jgi:hypothetical protein
LAPGRAAVDLILDTEIPMDPVLAMRKVTR